MKENTLNIREYDCASAVERRRSERTASPKPTVFVELPGYPRRAIDVNDISLSGVGLDFEEQVPPELIRTLSCVEIDIAGRAYMTLVTPVHCQRLRERGRLLQRVGLQFRHASRELLEDLCVNIIDNYHFNINRSNTNSLRTQTTITDPRRIDRLCHAIARNHHHVQLFDESHHLIGEAIAREFSEGTLVFDRPQLELRRMQSGQAISVSVTSMNSHYTFRVSEWLARDPVLVARKPESMTFGGVRAGARVHTRPECPVSLTFLHPLIAGSSIEKQAIDVGGSGLGFVLAPKHDLLVPGLVVESAQLQVADAPPIPCGFEVRHIRRLESGDYVCGVRLHHTSARNRQIWLESVLRQVAPRVEQASQWDLDEVWSVFESSRYLDEKPRPSYERIAQDFRRVWHAVLEHHNSSRVWIYREAGRAFGTLSLTRLYSNAWVAHHLAADLESYDGPHEKLNIPLELCSGAMLNWLNGISDNGSLVTYFSAHRKFNHWAWFDFLRMFNDRVRCAMDSFVFHEYLVDTVARTPRSTMRCSVRSTTPNDREVISQLLRERDGELIWHVFDYSAQRLTLESYREDVDVVEYQRSRGVFVGVIDGRIAGFALAEAAASGSNIFSLFNIARVVVLDEAIATIDAPEPLDAESVRINGDDRDELTTALFDAVVEHYRSRQLDDFMLFQGPGDAPPPKERAPSFSVDGVRGAVSAEVAAHWMAYLNDIFGHRRARPRAESARLAAVAPASEE